MSSSGAGLCISIKLLDEAARLLLLLFFCRYCLLSALPSPNFLPPPFLPETAQRPPAGRSAQQLFLASPPSLCAAPTCQPHAASRSISGMREPFIAAALLLAGPTKVPCLRCRRSTRGEIHSSREAGKWKRTIAFLRSNDSFRASFWSEMFMGDQQNAFAALETRGAATRQHPVLSMSPQTQMLTVML